MKFFEGKTFFIIAIGVVIFITLAVLSWLDISKQYQQEMTPITKDKEEKKEFPIIGTEFGEVIAQLNSSQKLIDYLNENFIFEIKEEEDISSPQEFFKIQKGNSRDFAIFTSYVLWKHKYEAGIICYKIEDFTNTVVVFRDEDLPKTIIFTPIGTDIYHHGWSFEEMFQKEEERLGAKINEYTISYWTDEGELWPEEWEKR
jgi:hypothetical protein